MQFESTAEVSIPLHALQAARLVHDPAQGEAKHDRDGENDQRHANEGDQIKSQLGTTVPLLEGDAADKLTYQAAELPVVQDRMVRHPADPAPLILANAARHMLAPGDFLEERFALRAPVS